MAALLARTSGNSRHRVNGPTPHNPRHAALRNLHPDLKLGVVLVPAAVLLNVVGWATFAFEGFSPLLSAGDWLIFPVVIAGLAVIPVAIWVDRGPPHKLMAAGAVVAALGLPIRVLFDNFALVALGVFVSIVGAAAVVSLVFYAVVAKGSTRYKGTLIGALGMVFAMRLGDGVFREWANDSRLLVLGIGIALILAGGLVLLRFLPRVFTYSYGPGPTLQQELVVPRVRRAVVGATAAYSIAYMAAVVMITALPLIPAVTPSFISGMDSIWFPRQAMNMAVGISALLWGIASDFYPVRRLLFIAGILLPAVTVGIAAIDPFSTSAAGVLAVGLVRGGLICLPWVLLAELLPTRHFAKIAVGITVILAPLVLMLVQILLGALADDWFKDAHFWVIPVLGIALAFVASRLPKPLEAAPVPSPTKPRPYGGRVTAFRPSDENTGRTP